MKVIDYTILVSDKKGDMLMDEKIWSLLRRPFALPQNVDISHTCRWEAFTFSKYGCTLCGKIHSCDDGRCEETVQCNYGTVCALSGIVVNTCNFEVNEWDTNYPSYAVKRGLSTRCKTDKNQDLVVQKAILELLQHCENMPDFGSLCEYLNKQVCTTIAFLSTEMGMKLKMMDYKNFTFGMLYLMKSGIQLHGVHILPTVVALQTLLPPESQLQRRFNFKCKNITDVENKIKLLLRDMSAKQLQSACWNMTTHSEQIANTLHHQN